MVINKHVATKTAERPKRNYSDRKGNVKRLCDRWRFRKNGFGLNFCLVHGSLVAARRKEWLFCAPKYLLKPRDLPHRSLRKRGNER